jgi:hypothetical protein
MSYFRAHNCVKTVATTTNLVRILNFRPQNWAEAQVKMKAFALHPSVYYNYMGMFVSVGWVTAVLGVHTPGQIAASDNLHRDLIRENYKREHGHYHT